MPQEQLNQLADEEKRQDSFTILALMKQVTKAEPRMWGTSIVGFGDDNDGNLYIVSIGGSVFGIVPSS